MVLCNVCDKKLGAELDDTGKIIAIHPAPITINVGDGTDRVEMKAICTECKSRLTTQTAQRV